MCPPIKFTVIVDQRTLTMINNCGEIPGEVAHTDTNNTYPNSTHSKYVTSIEYHSQMITSKTMDPTMYKLSCIPLLILPAQRETVHSGTPPQPVGHTFSSVPLRPAFLPRGHLG